MKIENYKENAEIQLFPDLDIVVDRFKKTGRAKAKEQHWIYESISRNWCKRKTVVDLGCGIGWGTNILGREARITYGFDINTQSINWAHQMYRSPTIRFDVLDLTKTTKKLLPTADVVCAIEVIEHISDYDVALESIKSFGEPVRGTVYWISSPNRNNHRLQQDGPQNMYHVREWTAGEFYIALKKHFGSVVLYGVDSWDWFEKGNIIDVDSKAVALIAKCENPLKSLV